MAELWAELPFAAAVAAQVTVWLLIGGAASLLWRRHAARAHRALVLAVLAALVTPLGVMLVRRAGWGVLPNRVPTSAVAPAAAIASPVPADRSEPESGLRPPATAASTPLPAAGSTSAAFSIPWVHIGAAGWGVLSAACFLVLSLSYVRGRRIAVRSRPCPDALLRTAVRREALRLGVAPRPGLRTSPEVRCPMVWPWRRPPLLLLPSRSHPRDAAVRWNAVLCHELAHLRRRDHLVSLASLLLLAVFPWHPLAWWVRKRLARLAEIACDDRVLAEGHPAPDYADSLLRLASLRRIALALPAVSSRSELAKRVRSILEKTRRRPDAGRVWTGAASILCVALAATLALAQEAAPGRDGEPPTAFTDDLRLPDPRPATVQIPEITGAIREELARLGTGGPAGAWRERLASLEAELAGPLKSARGAERELHAVGVYEGEHAPGVGHHAVGTVRVRVERAGVPVTLALSSYEPVDWEIDVADGVVLERVLVTGYYRQRVHGVGETPVTVLSSEAGSPAVRICHEKGSGSYAGYARWLVGEAGLDLTTFQGRYSGRGEPIVVGEASADWRAEILLGEFRALEAEVLRSRRSRLLEELSELRFPAVRHGVEGSAWGVFSVLGPRDGKFDPIPGGLRHVVRDPATGRFYALSVHDVLTCGPGEERFVRLDRGPLLAELSWPNGLAFDTDRRRLVIAGRGVDLWIHDVERRSWATLEGPRDLDIRALAYDANRDRLLAIGRYRPDRATWLFTLDPDGRPVMKTPIDREIPGGRWQLVPVEGRIVLLVHPGEDVRSPEPRPHCYVIDRSNGKTVLGLRQPPR
jgi:beta-lactamase regulating signal transducer with metallopeptidase domain